MSVTVAQRTVAPRRDRLGLAELAETALRALEADAVIVTARAGGEQRGSLAAAAGVDGRLAHALHEALADVEATVGPGEAVSIPSLFDDGRTVGADWGTLGFHGLLAAPLELDGETMGTLHALYRKRPARTAAARSMVAAFGRHTAVALAHRGLARRSGRMAEMLPGMAALDEQVLMARTFEETSVALAAAVGPLVGADMTGIMMLDEQRDVLQMLPGAFGAPDEVTASYRIRASDLRSNAARVLLTGRPYMSNHAAGDPGILQDYVEVLHVERLMSLPLHIAGRAVGVLHFANKAGPFTMDDLAKAEALAPRVATVVELARTVLQLRRQQRLEGILAEMAVGIASGRSLQELLSRASGELGEVIEASVVALIPRDVPPVVWRRERREPRWESAMLEQAKRHGPARSFSVPPSGAGDPGHAGHFVPVVLSAKRIATLAALRRRGEPFASDERDALQRIANLAALAWATERYQHQRAELARLRERQRIADDLHDTVAQILFAAQLNLESVLEHTEDRRTADSIEHARALLLKGDAAIRRVIHQLSRPPRADLAHRLEILVGALEDEFGLSIHIEIPEGVAKAAKTIRRPVADTMVKVAQEAVVNAAKHAGPCRVALSLSITRGGHLLLTVVDDGLGPMRNGNGEGHGLASMRRALRENGGRLRVSAGRYGGTKVTASVPL